MTEARAQQPSSIGRAIAGWSGRGLVERYGIAVIGVALGLALRAALGSLLEGSGAYGGAIAPRPNPEGGTVFSFTLPMVTREEVGDAV
jgi:hypothetical protein